uniref:Uncharacterized protein n=1 Tax=Lactuca sativa TaxID=4236 RepID=A0A9R1WL94_LACSA|nr:hypothetical protein LSAT_V11C100006570 [Lactuca sativa]
MDSWSFNSVVKAFVDDESLSTADAFEKDETGSIGWDVKPPFISGNNMGLFPNKINIENQLFGDIGFPPLMRNSLFTPAMAASQNAFSEGNMSSSKLQSNSRESELFDLKLDGFPQFESIRSFYDIKTTTRYGFQFFYTILQSSWLQ